MLDKGMTLIVLVNVLVLGLTVLGLVGVILVSGEALTPPASTIVAAILGNMSASVTTFIAQGLRNTDHRNREE
jgi:hypothetical protein